MFYFFKWFLFKYHASIACYMLAEIVATLKKLYIWEKNKKTPNIWIVDYLTVNWKSKHWLRNTERRLWHLKKKVKTL